MSIETIEGIRTGADDPRGTDNPRGRALHLPGGKSLGAAQLWHAVRLLSACALAYGGAWLCGLHDRFWAMITAVVVTQPLLQATLAAGRDRVIGTVLGALVGLGVVLAVRHGWPRIPTFCAALVPLALITAVWPNMRLSCITLIVVVLVPADDLSFNRPIERVLEILLGTLASVLTSAASFEGWREPRR